MSRLLQAEDSGVPMSSVRAVGRVDNWWYSKVAPVLAVSYCAALIYRVPAWATARSILLIAFVGLCAGSYGHIVNDVFDIEVDRRAGKRNVMAGLARWKQALLCAAALALGFAPAMLVKYSLASLLLLGVEYLLPTIYSVPPLRLKGRGRVGLLCDSLGSHLVPCFYVISVLAHQSGRPAWVHARSAIAFVWLVGVWAFCLGLIGIIIHEYQDRENDLRSGIQTFATSLAFRDVRSAVNALYAAELIAFTGLVAILFPVAPLLAVMAAIYSLSVAIKIAGHWHHYRRLDEEPTTIQWWQLSHPLYEAYFPLGAALQCAWIHPSLTIFPVLQVAAFTQTFRRQIPEFRELRTQLLLRGRLDLDQGAVVHVTPLLFPPWAARIDIRQSGPERWSVRVARTGFAIRRGRKYAIKLVLRADCPRAIVFGVWQDHAPWGGAGFCEELQVLPRWQTVRRRFVAAGDHPLAYLGLWLGKETSAVELRHCSIRAV